MSKTKTTTPAKCKNGGVGCNDNNRCTACFIAKLHDIRAVIRKLHTTKAR